ncbi:ketopantoate reductase family protein [Paenactinomyces guangxiensis]|uniref:2-dehydropantoate 2-reductase n=1 Tax=Paenactinomyces guangxiensis TaxID=1490290 RepID=A0A7W2A8C9_9BACL|nr:ketopantoate reductase family protein [Paenactinomyces guangxiensis]MBA4494027.1 ketopantoate reductase family protein [Paenactinomyces guangxiensis]MBH8591228.1 ketopantoate reductase family protein [Paenactinomyces guangxiensis]
MRVLIVGAGAVGGYFGGRLVEKGADVTFLVRERRKQELDRHGLVIKSVHGDAALKVKTLLSGQPADPFDLILLSVKAYHLGQTLASLQPYVGKNTAILPLLNGISHLQEIKKHFGEEVLLGGLCFIESTLNAQGQVEQYSAIHEIVFGELHGETTERVRQIGQLFAGANMQARHSRQIKVEMWKKYIFINAMSGLTSLMRSSIGPILASPFGRETYLRFLHEIVAIARTQEPSLPADLAERILSNMEKLEPAMKSSMLRDMEKGLPIETDHLHGALIQLAAKKMDLPLLKTVYSTLKIYQNGRN